MMRLLSALALATLLGLATAQLDASNVVVVFNNAAQDDVRTLGIQNQLSTKVYALVHLAQHLSIQQALSASDTVKAGRAAFAAHAVLDQLFPWRFFKHDAVVAPFAAALSDADRADASKAGTAIAAALIASRTTDGVASYVNFVPAPAGGTAGVYQFVTNQTYALYPQLATARPFVITNVSAYDVAGPNPVTSVDYTADLAEVFAFGAKNSSSRTQTQTDTAYFWADGSTTSSVIGHFNTIAQKVIPPSTPLAAVAQVFAQLNVAAFDASVAGWAVKYKYLFWRPQTAIRQGDNQPANAAYVKADWTPELSTPAHPEFASGHQYSVASAAGVLASFLGTGTVNVNVTTEYPALSPRTYSSLQQIVDDVGNSRVWGGVHFRRSITVGNNLGARVAGDVLANWNVADLIDTQPRHSPPPLSPPAPPPPSPHPPSPPPPSPSPPKARPAPKRKSPAAPKRKSPTAPKHKSPKAKVPAPKHGRRMAA